MCKIGQGHSRDERCTGNNLCVQRYDGETYAMVQTLTSKCCETAAIDTSGSVFGYSVVTSPWIYVFKRTIGSCSANYIPRKKCRSISYVTSAKWV